MLDEIELRLKGAIAKDVVEVVCCFKSCRRKADYMLVLRYPSTFNMQARTDAYGLCAQDMAKVRSNHPSMLEKTTKQGVFLY